MYLTWSQFSCLGEVGNVTNLCQRKPSPAFKPEFYKYIWVVGRWSELWSGIVCLLKRPYAKSAYYASLHFSGAVGVTKPDIISRDADRYTEPSVFRYRYGIPTIPKSKLNPNRYDLCQMSPYRKGTDTDSYRTDTEPKPTYAKWAHTDTDFSVNSSSLIISRLLW